MNKLIKEQIAKIKPLIKEAPIEQKVKFLKLMKVALKESIKETEVDEAKILSPHYINLYLQLKKHGTEPILVNPNNPIPYKAMDALIDKISNKYSNIEPDMFYFTPVESSNQVKEENQRLDPKCWSGYHKAGTKMKGNTRVANEDEVEEGWKSKIAGAALAGAVGAGAMGYHDATPDIEYKGYIFQHAPLNVRIPGTAHYVKLNGKEYIMWKNLKPSLPGNPEYLYKLKSEADIENAVNEDYLPEK